jgi:N4-(beta-N-acetylglucosaminyl)-L-asparaginase
MNNNRRSFYQKTGNRNCGIGCKSFGSMAKELPGNNIVTNKPIVLSTWNFGIKANEEAWTILGKEVKHWMLLKKESGLWNWIPKKEV